jgi:hypothetical protein
MSNWYQGRLFWLLALGAGLIVLPYIASAQQNYLPREAAQWAKEAEHQGTLAPGMVITRQNYQQYKSFFPYGIQTFWEGTGFWKMPDDVEIHVVPTEVLPLPKLYVAATEKYGNQTKLVPESDGKLRLENYIAGSPFPNPSGPLAAAEVAADVTYRMGSFIVVAAPDAGTVPALISKDRFGNASTIRNSAIYRQLAYNWQPGYPQVDPRANGAWYTEYLEIIEPEQSKYTAALTVLWQDNLKEDDDYIFVPALRRSLRLSVSARCAPLFGTDMMRDDQRVGWNGGVGAFTGEYFGVRKILGLVQMDGDAAAKFPDAYDGMLGWPKPSWGPWELRDVWVANVHRIPQMAPGYCYGARFMYVDTATGQTLAEDLYDSNLKLWKVVWVGLARGDHGPVYGNVTGGGGIIENFWDVQNDHVSYVTTYGPDYKGGVSFEFDNEVPKQYDDVTRYSSPAGMSQIMQ